MQNKLKNTFGGKFSVFGYSDPNNGISQSEPANESRYFINDIDIQKFPLSNVGEHIYKQRLHQQATNQKHATNQPTD